MAQHRKHTPEFRKAAVMTWLLSKKRTAKDVAIEFEVSQRSIFRWAQELREEA